MDAEDVHQLLTQTRLRCLLLEAERDAEIVRASKYRKILGSLAGEDGATRLQVAGNLHIPSRTLSLAEGQGGSTIARCPSVHSPVAGRSCLASDRTAAAVPQAHSVCLLCTHLSM